MLGDIYRDRYDNMAVYSGSQGEGISKIGESDTDILYLLSGYMCVTNQKVWQRVPSLGTVFTIANTYPGNCTLELARHKGSCHHAIETSLVIKNGSHFLSSSKFKAAEIGTHTPKEPALAEMTGPALTVTDVCGVMFDFVYTISCECQQILQTWASRRRKYDWPPLSLRQVIPNMNGNLVATGMQNSETEDLEWRYCFNEIEGLIFENLNDTQMKLYNMLKIINNDILKKQNMSLSSYLMKNIVLWLAEYYKQSEFRPETLLSWVLTSLRLLKLAVKRNNLPYYMIPKRNMLKKSWVIQVDTV
mgnify:CR=1 FL=1